MEEIINCYFERLQIHNNNDLIQTNKFQLFNIRLKNSLRIESINFNNRGNNNLQVGNHINNLYSKVIIVMEFWYTYEALIKAEGNFTKKNSKFHVPRDIRMHEGVNISFEEGLAILRQQYDNDVNFRGGFNALINNINENIEGESIRRNCNALLNYLSNQQGVNLGGLEILALIYGERNMYVHNGSTSINGMTYNDREFMLNFYSDYLCRHILRLAIYFINIRLAQINL